MTDISGVEGQLITGYRLGLLPTYLHDFRDEVDPGQHRFDIAPLFVEILKPIEPGFGIGINRSIFIQINAAGDRRCEDVPINISQLNGPAIHPFLFRSFCSITIGIAKFLALNSDRQITEQLWSVIKASIKFISTRYRAGKGRPRMRQDVVEVLLRRPANKQVLTVGSTDR